MQDAWSEQLRLVSSPIAQTVHDRVYTTLRRRIVTGRLPPSARLSPDDVAAEFGVSRIPVREAMRRLQAEHFIVVRPHRTATVASLSLRRLRECYSLRAVLEPMAARLAIPVLTGDDLERLRRLLGRIQQTAEERDVESHLDLLEDFHLGIYGRSDHCLLVETIASFRLNCFVYRHIYYSAHPEELLPGARWRAALLVAVERRRADVATELISERVVLVQGALVEHLRSLGVPEVPLAEPKGHRKALAL